MYVLHAFCAFSLVTLKTRFVCTLCYFPVLGSTICLFRFLFLFLFFMFVFDIVVSTDFSFDTCATFLHYIFTVSKKQPIQQSRKSPRSPHFCTMPYYIYSRPSSSSKYLLPVLHAIWARASRVLNSYHFIQHPTCNTHICRLINNLQLVYRLFICPTLLVLFVYRVTERCGMYVCYVFMRQI